MSDILEHILDDARCLDLLLLFITIVLCYMEYGEISWGRGFFTLPPYLYEIWGFSAVLRQGKKQKKRGAEPIFLKELTFYFVLVI